MAIKCNTVDEREWKPRFVEWVGGHWQILSAVLVASVFSGFIFVSQSVRSPIPDHGDTFTDMQYILMARGLNKYGFGAFYLVGTFDDRPELGKEPWLYSHHPAFPALLLAQAQRLGFNTTQARLIPLLAATSALVATFLLARRLTSNWRLGLLALVALGASAPFRLLSDTFMDRAYDFPAKLWGMLLVTDTSLAGGRLSWKRRLALAVTPFLTIILVGWETGPEMAAFTALAPLLLAPGHILGRIRRSLGMCVPWGIGVLLGISARLAQNALALGSFQASLRDFSSAFLYRSGGQGVSLFDTYARVVQRVWAYYPAHLLLAGLGLLCMFFLLAAKRASDVDWRWPKIVLVVFVVENAWYCLLRQHAYIHAHTIQHLAVSMSLAAAWGAGLIWRLLRDRVATRTFLIAAGCILLFMTSTDVLTTDLADNLAVRVDAARFRNAYSFLYSGLPPDAVVGIDTKSGIIEPMMPFFLDRTFIFVRGGDNLEKLRIGSQRPWFLCTVNDPTSPPVEDALLDYRLIAVTAVAFLFDTSAPPGDLNTAVLEATRNRDYPLAHVWEWSLPLEAVVVQPAASENAQGGKLAIPLAPGPQRALTVLVSLPEWLVEEGKSDGVSCSFQITGPNIVGSPIRLDISPETMRAHRSWVPVPIDVPETEHPLALVVDVDCGTAGDCFGDAVWLGLGTERYAPE